MPMYHQEQKSRLNEAFRVLRKNGFIAQQNFKCCMSCAIAALDPMIKKNTKAGKPVRGVVYYHRQDADSFKEAKGTTLMIRFGAPSDTAADITAVARETIEVFAAAGLATEWNGDNNCCIEVPLN